MVKEDEDSVPDELRSLDTFKLAKQGKQKVGQSFSRIFPYCLLVFGPAQTCLYERTIMVKSGLGRVKTTRLIRYYV